MATQQTVGNIMRTRYTIVEALLKRSFPLIREVPPAGILLIAVTMTAIFAGVLSPHDPTQNNLAKSLLAPIWQSGDASHILGTDLLGRDVLSRLLHGARVSLVIAAAAVILSGFIGTCLGLISGYLGGAVDAVIMRLTDAVLALPYILLALALATILGPSTGNVIIVLAAIYWARYVRIIRSEVLRLRESDFVRLAIVAGAGRPRIMIRHIFPSVVNTLIVLATLQLGVAIIAESGLSFLGLGVRPPASSWGLMLAEGRGYITVAWWLSVFPGLAITLTVLAANLFGDWLRIRLDPKYRQL